MTPACQLAARNSGNVLFQLGRSAALPIRASRLNGGTSMCLRTMERLTSRPVHRWLDIDSDKRQVPEIARHTCSPEVSARYGNPPTSGARHGPPLSCFQVFYCFTHEGSLAAKSDYFFSAFAISRAAFAPERRKPRPGCVPLPHKYRRSLASGSAPNRATAA